MNNYTAHASVRCQQRCIPPLINQWLSDFGAKEHDGHGCVKRFFNKQSIKQLKKEVGSEPVKLLSKYLTAYKVEAYEDKAVVTIGYLSKRIKRG